MRAEHDDFLPFPPGKDPAEITNPQLRVARADNGFEVPQYDGARMWTHAPGRMRLHRLSNIFADPTLHDLARNDIYWDKVVDIDSLGRWEIPDFSEYAGHPVVVQGVLMQPAGI